MSDSHVPLIWEPNRHADDATIRSSRGIHYVGGYQRYIATSAGKLLMPLHRNLRRKAQVVLPAMQLELDRLGSASFADFGCNTGFFLLAARRQGYCGIHGYDLDEGVRPVFDSSLMKEVAYLPLPIQEVEDQLDVTLSISLFHWLIGQYGDDAESLDHVVALLASRSRHTATVELVTSDDPLVVTHGHYGQKISEEIFVQRCADHFERIELLGYSSPTRLIFSLRKD